MAWNHDDVAPNRSRDDLLSDVVRRGERIRSRRRLVGGLGGGVALLLAVAGVVTLAGTGREPSTQLAAGGRATTTLAVPTTGGTMFAVDAPTTTVDATLPTALEPVPTTVPEPVTTVAAAPPAVPETTVPGPKQPRCGPGVMQATITMASSFAAGQPVSGQAVLRNTSGAPCYYFSYTARQEITDNLGNPVVPGAALIADAFEDTPFGPGQTLTQPVQWSAGVPGSYVAKVSWSFDGPPVEATATFVVA
ncbi:MAG: hypothetical protein QOG43_2621 [Actinomycetota bacterium]|nr:hypothetical protein [Actinomycetota bacterium]